MISESQDAIHMLDAERQNPFKSEAVEHHELLCKEEDKDNDTCEVMTEKF